MGRRASLPGASELFRPTGIDMTAGPERRVETGGEDPKPAEAPAEKPPVATGRVRHDHKITVYFSEDELLALEDANLDLRRKHGIRIDRGRFVRTAVALAIIDMEAEGDDSALVQHLRE